MKKEERFYVIDHIKNKSFNLWKRDDFNTNRHTIQYDYQDHIKKCQEDGINKKGENV